MFGGALVPPAPPPPTPLRLPEVSNTAGFLQWLWSQDIIHNIPDIVGCDLLYLVYEPFSSFRDGFAG